jgi:epoxyqueuosine reductase
MTPSERVLEIAREVGFDLAGIAPLRAPRRAPEFEAWLRAGRHGEMEYLAADAGRITDPRSAFGRPGSILAVGLAHARTPFVLADGTRIARYAAGRDYHNVFGRMLRKLAKRLRAAGLCGEFKKVVDAGPLLERSHAAEAGLGFESKAANLLHPRFGPWFFLGELILDVEYEPTSAPVLGSCGTCTACLDACPTSAIVNPGEVDARRCISYLTIEARGPVPAALREHVGDWAFGCDVCSEVCPWTRRAPDTSARWGTTGALAGSTLVEWLAAPDQLAVDLAGSPLQRAGREGLARNALTVLGNRPSELGRRALLVTLSDALSATLREAAAGALALGHGADADARAALEQAAARELDPVTRAAIESWRAQCR